MNEDIKSNARNYTLDAIAGLLILRMIYGHMVGYAGLKNSFLFEICNALYFYMPWFFFKSGMFSQPYRMTVGGVKKEIKRYRLRLREADMKQYVVLPLHE